MENKQDTHYQELHNQITSELMDILEEGLPNQPNSSTLKQRVRGIVEQLQLLDEAYADMHPPEVSLDTSTGVMTIRMPPTLFSFVPITSDNTTQEEE